MVQQNVVYSVLSGAAVLNIGNGTTVRTAGGQPLPSISVVEVCIGIPPAPPGAYIIGCAYDYKPDGATFNPAITLTIKYDPGLVPAGVNVDKLVIAFYDNAAKKWVLSTSTVDKVKHTVSAQASHFTLFAVYAPAPTPTITPTPTIAPTPTPTPTPAAGGLSGGWIALIVILVIIVVGLGAYRFMRKKPPKTS